MPVVAACSPLPEVTVVVVVVVEVAGEVGTAVVDELTVGNIGTKPW